MPALQTRIYGQNLEGSKSQTLPYLRSGFVNETSSHFSPHRDRLLFELLRLILQSPFFDVPQWSSISGPCEWHFLQIPQSNGCTSPYIKLSSRDLPCQINQYEELWGRIEFHVLVCQTYQKQSVRDHMLSNTCQLCPRIGCSSSFQEDTMQIDDFWLRF